jgi:flagellar hook-associated protein 2
VNTEAANANIGKTISLVDGDTLTDVATKFNAVSATTGIAASVVKTSPTQFDLVFNAITTGTDADFDLDNSGTTTVLADFSSALSNVTFSDTQAATNAVFTFDNLTITRQSNTVNDLIDNATLTIRQETPALTEVDITIGEDDSLVKAGILNFVSAYNELKFFESRLTELDKDNKPTKEAVLAGNSSVRLIYSRINDELTSAVSGVSSATVDRLASLGITFTDFPGDDTTPFTRNILNVDEASLDAVLASNFEDVRKIFEFDFESTDSNLQVFSRTNGLGINSFTLDIDQTNDSYKATYTTTSGPTTIDLNFSKLDGRGVVLTGQSGTVLEGLELIYSASNDVTGIGVTLTQGIGDRIWNSMKEILKEDTGLLDLETKSITDENTRLQKEIDRIDKIVERYRDQLLAEYAALEAAITTANTLLQTIAAQNAANEQRK